MPRKSLVAAVTIDDSNDQVVIVDPNPCDIKTGKHPEAYDCEATRNAREKIIRKIFLYRFMELQKANTHRKKRELISDAVREILNSAPHAGAEVRFLKRLPDGRWKKLTGQDIRNVVSHWLRDMSPYTTKPRSTTKNHSRSRKKQPASEKQRASTKARHETSRTAESIHPMLTTPIPASFATVRQNALSTSVNNVITPSPTDRQDSPPIAFMSHVLPAVGSGRPTLSFAADSGIMMPSLSPVKASANRLGRQTNPVGDVVPPQLSPVDNTVASSEVAVADDLSAPIPFGGFEQPEDLVVTENEIAELLAFIKDSFSWEEEDALLGWES